LGRQLAAALFECACIYIDVAATVAAAVAAAAAAAAAVSQLRQITAFVSCGCPGQRFPFLMFTMRLRR